MGRNDESARRLRRLAEVVEKIAAVHDVHSLFAIVRRAVRELTGADGATLVLRDNGQCHYADEDAIGPLWKGQRFPLEACISGWTMLHAEATVIEDIYADPRIPHAAYRPTFVKSLSMVPVGRKEPIGAIGCYWADRHKASAEEVELQQALADAMSVGLANIELYQEMKEARQSAERAAAEAKASEAALRVAQHLAGVGNWEWDIRAGTHIWSEEIYHIYGRDPALPPAAYPEVQQYFTPQSWEQLAAAVEKTRAEGVPYECDAEVVRPDGNRGWITVHGEAVRDAAGNIISMHGTVQDITQRKEAEKEHAAQMVFRESALRVQMILNTMADGIVTINAHGVIESFNPAAEQLFGFAAEEAIGQNVRMLMPEPYRSQHDGYLRSYCDTGEARVIGKGREVTGQRRNGSTFPMYLAISEMQMGDQRYFTGVVHDLTASKEIEQELVAAKERAELANHAKDSFLATMSHEIRTPLTGMLGMLELLSLTSLDDEQRSTLDAAWDSGRGLLRIVNDILDWSKIEEGKLELAPRPTSIPQLLQEVVNTYSRVASAKSLTLRQEVDERIGPAHVVDGLRLSQVLNNFVSNAIKFTQHGEVALHAELVGQQDGGERVRFSVRDTGIGIAREAQEQLFQRYQQGSADTARMYGGTGLGLSICRRLAEIMDGAIELKSEQGLGSIFSIVLTLPVASVPLQTIQNPHPEVRQRAVKPLFADSANVPSVLAVDDTPVNRNLLARQLRMLGLRAETAENGEAALAMWQKGNYALVITDCHMPEMDGYALTRGIRRIEAEEGRAHTPIIAWTANALAEESGRCAAAGMDDLLVKPAGMVQLRNMLAKWLDIPEAGDNPAPDERPSVQPLDYSVLDVIVEDDSEQVLVLRDFFSHIRVDHARLLEMLGQQDLAQVESTAHRMKGSSRMVGAGCLASACQDIEQAARSGNMSGVGGLRAALDTSMSQMEAHLLERGVLGEGL